MLEKALSYVGNQSIEVVCAGRTDTGVHAIGQVIHFDAPKGRDQSLTGYWCKHTFTSKHSSSLC